MPVLGLNMVFTTIPNAVLVPLPIFFIVFAGRARKSGVGADEEEI